MFTMACAILPGSIPSRADAPSPAIPSSCQWAVTNGARPGNTAFIDCPAEAGWAGAVIFYCERLPLREHVTLQFEVDGQCSDGRESCGVSLEIDSRGFDLAGDARSADIGEWISVMVPPEQTADIATTMFGAHRLVVAVEAQPARDLTLRNMTQAFDSVAKSCGYSG
jgi:hypothetical protein